MDNTEFTNYTDIKIEEPISFANKRKTCLSSIMVSSTTWKIVGIALLMLVLFFLLVFLADKSI